MRKKAITLAGAVVLTAAAGGTLVGCSDCKPCAASKPGMSQQQQHQQLNPSAAKKPDQAGAAKTMPCHPCNPCAAKKPCMPASQED